MGLVIGLDWHMIKELRAKVILLERLDTMTTQYCEGVQKVNDLCEEQFVLIMQRLGLDDEMMPLVTTTLWQRATHGMRVSRARRKLGAKEQASGLLGSNPLDREAVGGPSEE